MPDRSARLGTEAVRAHHLEEAAERALDTPICKLDLP
jgi:hypothetical protein